MVQNSDLNLCTLAMAVSVLHIAPSSTHDVCFQMCFQPWSRSWASLLYFQIHAWNFHLDIPLLFKDKRPESHNLTKRRWTSNQKTTVKVKALRCSFLETLRKQFITGVALWHCSVESLVVCERPFGAIDEEKIVEPKGLNSEASIPTYTRAVLSSLVLFIWLLPDILCEWMQMFLKCTCICNAHAFGMQIFLKCSSFEINMWTYICNQNMHLKHATYECRVLK